MRNFRWHDDEVKNIISRRYAFCGDKKNDIFCNSAIAKMKELSFMIGVKAETLELVGIDISRYPSYDKIRSLRDEQNLL